MTLICFCFCCCWWYYCCYCFILLFTMNDGDDDENIYLCVCVSVCVFQMLVAASFNPILVGQLTASHNLPFAILQFQLQFQLYIWTFEGCHGITLWTSHNSQGTYGSYLCIYTLLSRYTNWQAGRPTYECGAVVIELLKVLLDYVEHNKSLRELNKHVDATSQYQMEFQFIAAALLNASGIQAAGIVRSGKSGY